MDVDELRQMIRAAVLSAPLTVGFGCTEVPPRVEQPTPQETRAAPTDPSEAGRAGPERTEQRGEPETAPEPVVVDDDFERRWDEWSARQGTPPPVRPVSGPYTGAVPGRPLRSSVGAVRSDAVPGRAWCTTRSFETIAAPPRLGALLAERWREAALDEHASVASFARATLELMSLGAPPELVAAHQQASLEEVAHAQLCFSIAAAYGGAAHGPGPLAVPAPRNTDLARFACDVFVEACVNETAAAAIANHAASRCAIPSVRAALERIATDEASHAALAWRTVRWARDAGGEPVVRALHAIAEPELTPIARGLRADDLLQHGVLDRADERAVARDTWRRITVPLRAELLA